MRLLSEVRVPFDHIGSHVAHTGASFGLGVAYLLFALMFLSMIGEIFLRIVRAYFGPVEKRGGSSLSGLFRRSVGCRAALDSEASRGTSAWLRTTARAVISRLIR